MLWGSGAIFLRLLGSHREKISRWNNPFVFQRLMFLYQLVNLVLETCLIFSEILKLSKTYFLSWISRRVRSVEQWALWFPYSRLFFGIVFKRMLSFDNFFYKVNCGVDFEFFDTSLSERCLNRWLVKWKSWLLGLRCHVVNRLKVGKHGLLSQFWVSPFFDTVLNWLACGLRC